MGNAQKENRRSWYYWTEKDSCVRDETNWYLKGSFSTWACALEASAARRGLVDLRLIALLKFCLDEFLKLLDGNNSSLWSALYVASAVLRGWFSCIYLLTFRNNPIWKLLLLTSFYCWSNWGTERQWIFSRSHRQDVAERALDDSLYP